MATIFKATDLNTNQTVAVKVPLMQYESDPGSTTASSARKSSARR